MNRKKVNSLMFIILFLLTILFLIIQSINNKLNYSLQNLQFKVTKLSEENRLLFLEIEKNNNLYEIKKIAKEELNMIFPEEIIYIYE
jgi:cell division protein FtsL